MKLFKDSLGNCWSSFLWEGVLATKRNLETLLHQNVASFTSKSWAPLFKD